MFKYSPVSEYSLINLKNNHLFLNHFDKFNDPFECSCEILHGFPKKDPKCTRFLNLIRAWGFDESNHETAIEHYDEYVFSLEGTEPVIDSIIDRARISCFSKRSDNLLMWSHYADGLRGFCINFNLDLLLSGSSAGAFEVLYQKSPSVIDTAVIAVLNDQAEFHEDVVYSGQQEMKHLGTNRSSEVKMYEEYLEEVYQQNTEIYQKMLATKPIHWSYEEEVRIISETDSHGKSGEVFKYSPEAVKSIVLGEKMPEEHRKNLLAIIEQHPSPIAVKIASRAKGDFSVIVNDY